MLDSFSNFWWILAGVLIAVELATGTFYLLMLALGAVAAAVAQMMGLSASAQVVSAALLGGGATALWHLRRARHPQAAPAASNPDVILDIGQMVTVARWETDGTARVSYRGSQWDAKLCTSGPASPGNHRIVAVHGNRLELEPLS
ncbi:MAG: NfeD family protein [Betaproteobacteria bacterium]|nr:NfeD family protein [Betaproteobacteria bacterium]